MFETEAKVSLEEARALFPAHPDLTTIWRWCVRGYQGIQLEYVRNGRRILTSCEAVRRFQAAMREADRTRFAGRPPTPSHNQTQRTRSTQRRARDLQAAASTLRIANV